MEKYVDDVLRTTTTNQEMNLIQRLTKGIDSLINVELIKANHAVLPNGQPDCFAKKARNLIEKVAASVHFR